eukprot:2789108-Rhodomonas_salina.1
MRSASWRRSASTAASPPSVMPPSTSLLPGLPPLNLPLLPPTPPGLCLPLARELSRAVQVGCITNTCYVSPGLSAH